MAELGSARGQALLTPRPRRSIHERVLSTSAGVARPLRAVCTESGMFRLNERSVQVLKGLSKPTHVYLLMPLSSAIKSTCKSNLGARD